MGRPVSGAIDVAGKRMHYRVAVSASVTSLAVTEANPTDTPGALDTVVSVFDQTGTTLLAAMDDASPRSGTDTQVFFRPRVTGFVCLRVEDFSTWNGTMPLLPSPNQFTLAVHAGGTGNLVAEVEPNNSGAGQSLPAASAVFIGGALDGASDLDVFSFTVPTGRSLLNVELPPNGDPLVTGGSSYGSTLSRIAVSVQSSTGSVIAALGPAPLASASSLGLSVPVTPGTYRVAISRPTSLSMGSNDFYGTAISASDDAPRELETVSATSNNSRSAAETLTLTTTPALPGARQAMWRGHLPTGDSFDYFRFTTTSTSNTLGIHCLAARDGSGLASFRLEVFGSGTTALRSETESPGADLLWGPGPGASAPLLTLPTAGTYYVVLSNVGFTAGNAGRFYRCSLEVTRP